MDTVTQILFGGVVGQAGFRNRLGRRATAVGGLLALVPDLDVVSGWFSDDVAHGWLHHRGVTHAIGPALIYGAALGWLVWRIERLRRVPFDVTEDHGRRAAWAWLGALSVATHPILDLFTAYGTQLLAPFSDLRFAIDAMPIIDPLYSLPLALTFLLGFFVRVRGSRSASGIAAVDGLQKLARFALIYVVLYTLMAWGVSLHMEQRARRELAETGNAGRHGVEVGAYPTLLQPFWRRLVADTEDEILIGFASPFDAREIHWERFRRQDHHPAVQAALKTPAGAALSWFAMGRVHWTVLLEREPTNGTGHVVEARDYRYGLPGESILGFWGLRFRLDAQHRLRGRPEVLSERPAPTENGFRQMWDGLRGK